jgi:hypothetical protein
MSIIHQQASRRASVASLQLAADLPLLEGDLPPLPTPITPLRPPKPAAAAVATTSTKSPLLPPTLPSVSASYSTFGRGVPPQTLLRPYAGSSDALLLDTDVRLAAAGNADVVSVEHVGFELHPSEPRQPSFADGSSDDSATFPSTPDALSTSYGSASKSSHRRVGKPKRRKAARDQPAPVPLSRSLPSSDLVSRPPLPSPYDAPRGSSASSRLLLTPVVGSPRGYGADMPALAVASMSFASPSARTFVSGSSAPRQPSSPFISSSYVAATSMPHLAFDSKKPERGSASLSSLSDIGED